MKRLLREADAKRKCIVLIFCSSGFSAMTVSYTFILILLFYPERVRVKICFGHFALNTAKAGCKNSEKQTGYKKQNK